MSATEDDFIELRRGNMYARVRRDEADVVAAALFHEDGCQPVAAVGRGNMTRFPWKNGRYGMLRVCRRGGLLGHVLDAGFLLRNRPREEFRIHRQILARGVPAPALLGVRWQRRGLFYYGALATELMPGCDLDAWLRTDKHDEEQTQALLRDCGALIRLMHDKGIYHADLQVKNIFVSEDGLFLLDFDGARTGDSVRPVARARNLLRLRRSLEKRGHPAEHWRHLLDGYGGKAPPRWLDAAYRVKALVSDMIQGRNASEA